MDAPILVVSQSRLMADMLQTLLSPQYSVHFMMGSDVEITNEYTKLSPSLVLIIGREHAFSWEEISHHLLNCDARARIALVDFSNEIKIVDTMMREKICGVLRADLSAKSFLQAVSLLIEGENVFPENGWLRRPGLSQQKAAHLTPRENEILHHLGLGKPNKSIAQELSISEGTIKVHIKTILKKLGVANRTQAAVYAHKNGLI